MAERIEMPLTTDITEPKDGTLGRSITETPSTSSGGKKILPHYLRASSGSCHDLCKYGGEHAFGAKKKHAIVKEMKTSLREGQNPTRSVSLQMIKKKPVVKSTPPARTWSCDGPEMSVRERKVLKQKALSPAAMRIDSVGKSSLTFIPKRETEKSPSSQLKLSQSCDGSEICKRESKVVKQKTLSPAAKRIDSVVESSLRFKPTRETTKSPSSELKHSRSCDEPEISKRKSKVVKQKTLSPAAKRIDSVVRFKPTRKTTKLPSSELHLSRSSEEHEISKRVSKVVKQKALSPATKKMDGVESSILFKPKHVTDKSASSQSNPTRIQSGRTSTAVKNNETSKSGQKRNLLLPKGNFSPKPYFNRRASLKTRKDRVLKVASPLKIENTDEKDESSLPIDENVTEKTLYVIEPKSEIKSLELDSTADGSPASLSSPSLSTSSSPHSSSLALHEEEEYIESEYDETADSEYEETETDSEYDQTENPNQLETLETEYKRRPRRGATIHPDGDDPAHKLKFRRGKVVDLQSENNTPRRLKFRKRRVLGDDRKGNGEATRRNFIEREINDGDDSAEPESGKVVLRHQDVNGRKDAQGLFNNVIEETASKLAETRKSKVKALVGAFETVISLQESKPSANNYG
ncbi:Plant calmodulin-binding protein-like protein [Thalictrum thalictroides]|uniref:Plant calmodulin-binding protein-like protein n=1 Tax=Thalictrum thalictroides TaxID=46969 RepID=A0A7J6WYB1_THATH|nr:Plant calmodulin-binding protein-like protein [Thalictrum thalictroides]